MKKTGLFIGLGVVALGGLIYFMMRKKSADSVETSETKSAKASEPTASSVSTAPSKGSALTKDRPTRTEAAPVAAAPVVATATAEDPLFLKFGITMADFNKMEGKRAELKEQIRKERGTGRGLMGGSIELMKRLSRFAGEQGISFGAYRNAKDAEVLLRSQGGAMGSVSPQTDPETEKFAFNLTF